MTKRIFALLCALALLICVAMIPASAVTSNPRLDDRADLLSPAEEQELSSKLSAMTDNLGYDFVMVTTPDLNNADFSFNGTCVDYADRYYESKGYAPDGVLVLITLSNENGKRNITFSTSGKLMKRLSEDEQDELLDDSLANYNPDSVGYYQFLYSIALGMEQAIPPHLNWYSLPLAILIGFIISLIIMLIARSGLKSVKMERGDKNYVRAGSMNVTASRDTFLYRTVNRTAKPKDNGGGSRTSSGGGSHGGISRDF